jgi:hypothetical protein
VFGGNSWCHQAFNTRKGLTDVVFVIKKMI